MKDKPIISSTSEHLSQEELREKAIEMIKSCRGYVCVIINEDNTGAFIDKTIVSGLNSDQVWFVGKLLQENNNKLDN